MKIINCIKTTEKYLRQKPSSPTSHIKVGKQCYNGLKSVRHASKIAGIFLTGALLLGQLAKRDANKNGIPDLVETMTEYFYKYPYKEMSNFNPTKPLAIWAGTNKELMNFYKQEHIYDQDLKNTMRHIVALAHTTQEYKSPIIARSLGYCKEIMDAFKFDFDKADWENNEIGINYVINNPDCSQDDIMQYAYKYAQDKNLQQNNK